VRPWLPWISLATGIASALTMNRGPRRAALVAGAALGLWLTLLVMRWLARGEHIERPGRRGKVLRLIRRSSLMATQSAVQLTLFFALPFYWHAATLEPGHVVFMAALSLLSAVSLWDPWTARAFQHRWLALLLPATSSFVALNAVLPGLGLSTHQSLWTAALIAVVGVALLSLASAAPGQRARATGISLAVALLLPLALELGAARLVPAAPLRLVQIELGTRVDGHWVVQSVERLPDAPERLFCATAIWSPVGVKDRLFHVWRYGGRVRSRIELDIRGGGRAGGYRTFSRIDHFGAHPAGVYSCSVETASGQVLGSRSLRMDSPRG
jgi:hypothetical protein